ncbi:MAG: methylenetetrahydrofolate reductase [NAD(P)H] [Candidatus Bostrichicola ureolyticus]|nr:MAG: methylenetetrahydrofolate reductase [NAD(P)H] [Candidatus Bostrichicola ureolyticus]
MKIIEHIANANKTLVSFEILPPLRGKSMDSIFNMLNILKEFNPAFINVTYHKNEKEELNMSRRPGTIGICAAIMNKYNIDTVPHLLCANFSKEIIEDLLIDLYFLGIDNILALRGDSTKYNHAINLVKQINYLNKGKYIYIEGGQSSNFCIGVAGYPEKHFESPNIETDILYLKEKVKAGANYIITQMFFDNKKYFHFVEKCRQVGIKVPIIPGIKPISSKYQLNTLPSNFYIKIPEELIQEIKKSKNEQSVYQVGIEWAIKQSKELINNGVKIIHYYTMGKHDNIYCILKEIY